MAGDLYKSNVLFMTHLGSVVSFIFSKKKMGKPSIYVLFIL